MAPPQLEHALQALRDGRVVAAATESFFGLLADVRNEAAIERLFAIKEREASKGVGLMVPGAEQWQSLVDSPDPGAVALARAHWPGPLSIVAPAAALLDERLCVGKTIAVRVPGECPAQHLVQAFGGAVTATSANLAGEPPCTSSEQVFQVFGGAVRAQDLVVLPGACAGGAVSTLASVVGSELKVLRAGAVSEELLKKTLASA